jgi:hypothetical protein
MRLISVIRAALCCLAITLAAAPAAARSVPPEEVESRFLGAMAEMGAGRPGPAAVALRSILAADPTLVRVRLELARAYFLMRDWDDARREFVAVLSGALPPEVRRKVMQFLSQIDARRGFDWSLSAAFSPNFGSARDYVTDEAPVTLNGQQLTFRLTRRDPPPFTLDVKGAAELQRPIPSQVGARLAAYGGGFFAVSDAPQTQDDAQSVGLRAGVRAIWPRTTASAGLRTTHRRTYGEDYESRVGVEASVERRFSDGLSVFGAAGGDILDAHDRQDRDGTAARLRLGVSRAIGGRGALGVALSVNHETAEVDFLSFNEFRAEMFGYADLGYGLRADGALFGTRLLFGDVQAPFVTSRRETELGGDVTFTKQDLVVMDIFSPFVKLGASWRRSSIAAFGYDELRFGFGLTRAF